MNCRALAAAFIISILLRIGFAVERPNWQSPDEFPHFYYAAVITYEGRLPGFLPEYPYYESFQPPLYYLLSAGVIGATSFFTGLNPETVESLENAGEGLPEMIMVRLFSLVLGLLAIFSAGRSFKAFFPLDSELPGWAAILLLMHPTFLSTTTSITNDALAILIGSLLVYEMVSKKLMSRPLITGLLLGAGLFTKSNMLLFFPIVALYLLINRNHLAKALKFYVSIAGPSALLLLLLYVAAPEIPGNILLSPAFTGNNDTLSLFRIFQVPRNLFWSFWAAFGRYYEVRPPDWTYIGIFFPFTLFSLWGMIKYVRNGLLDEYKGTIYTLITAVLIFVSASLFYSFMFFGGVNTSWGKNLFPVIVPILILITSGIYYTAGKWTRYTVLIFSLLCLIINIRILGTLTGLF